MREPEEEDVERGADSTVDVVAEELVVMSVLDVDSEMNDEDDEFENTKLEDGSIMADDIHEVVRAGVLKDNWTEEDHKEEDVRGSALVEDSTVNERVEELAELSMLEGDTMIDDGTEVIGLSVLECPDVVVFPQFE